MQMKKPILTQNQGENRFLHLHSVLFLVQQTHLRRVYNCGGLERNAIDDFSQRFCGRSFSRSLGPGRWPDLHSRRDFQRLLAQRMAHSRAGGMESRKWRDYRHAEVARWWLAADGQRTAGSRRLRVLPLAWRRTNR